MLRRRELPVYLFTGFLESGKTSFIKEIVQDGEFNDGARTLLFICEEGIEELDEELLKENKITPVYVEEEEELTREYLQKLEEKHRPHRIMIEFNGTWDQNIFLDTVMPSHWILVQVFTTVDSTTYPVYLSNMKQMILNQVQHSDLVVFNRCTDDVDRAAFRRSVKAVNRRAQIVYENMDGEVDSNVEEQLPFDIQLDHIKLEDDDYGLWYLDIMDHIEKYIGKTMTFKALVYKGEDLASNEFVPGRFAMTCCADDIAFIGFVGKYDKVSELKERQWIHVTAKIKKEYRKDYEGEGPVLYVEQVVPAEKPEEDLVYFN